MAVYPEATFRLVEGEDPTGLYLGAYNNAEDAFAVLDLDSDWLVDLSVNAACTPRHPLPHEPQHHTSERRPMAISLR